MENAVKGKIVEIAGEKMLIQHWDVDKQLEVLVWLTKNFGEGVLNMFMEGGDVDDYLPEVQEDADGNMSKESMKTMADFVSSIFEKLNPNDHAYYAIYIVDVVKHKGNNRLDVNKIFRGKMVALHALIFQVLRYQYSDFLAESIDQ